MLHLTVAAKYNPHWCIFDTDIRVPCQDVAMFMPSAVLGDGTKVIAIYFKHKLPPPQIPLTHYSDVLYFDKHVMAVDWLESYLDQELGGWVRAGRVGR